VDFWELDQRDTEQREALQRMLFAQFDPVNIVCTFHKEGSPLTLPTRINDPIELVERGFQHHQSVSDARMEAFEGEVPLSEAVASGLAWGRVYLPEDAAAPVVPLAIASGTREQVVALEVSLSDLDQHMASQALTEGGTVLLADGILLGEDRGLIDVGLVNSFVGDVGGELEYELDGRGVVAVFQSVQGTNWKVIVAVPATQVAMGADAIRERYLYIFVLAMVFALAVGVVAAGQVSRPIAALREAAQKLGGGRLGHQVQTRGAAEVVELGEAFNAMSITLQENAAEIETFNQDLKNRVDERTAELRESQDRLVQTARMAAVAQMGAGLAHELNNPIAGILGLAQVASMRAEGSTATMLKNIEEQALRCRDILASLNRFSGASGEAGRAEVDLSEVLVEVLALVGGGFEQAGVEVVFKPEQPLVVHGDQALLGQALAQLLRSLRTRLAPGGTLRIEGEAGDELCLRFSLEAPLREGGDDWLASGMGFWVARRVFQDHGGRLREPIEGDAPHWLLELPTKA
jgi:two-component system, NtrC family, sensor kinase